MTLASNGAGALSLSGCPFCGRRPHQGPTKLEHCQLHGEPFRSYRVWCPAGCADITAPEREQAVKRWNTRVPLLAVEAGEQGKARLPLPAASGAASGWMKISSAPRDGTRILAVEAFKRVSMDEDGNITREHPEDMEVVFWSEKMGAWVGYGMALMSFEPTHWMQRPQAPTVEGGSNG